jgi:FAD/FMN-containing dehydrogenase
MRVAHEIHGFRGQLVGPADEGYDRLRELWNAAFDHRPALIARCRDAADVAAAIRHGRDAGLELGVRCGGHSFTGASVPDGGLMIDLTRMADVRVDAAGLRAWVGGGALLRYLDLATEPYRLATTAGNVSHTGVGGLTLGGGMGWLARQAGLACDNVVACTVITADGRTVRASADEEPELYFGLRGGGGNFGVVTEFEFRLHPMAGRAMTVDLYFEPEDGPAAMRAWRELLPDAPRAATLTADAFTWGDDPSLPAAYHRRPLVAVGFVWVGDLDEGRRYLERVRQVGRTLAEDVSEMGYVQLQQRFDAGHGHGRRRYGGGHYLRTLDDTTIAAFLGRGVDPGAPEPDWTRVPGGDLQAHGGAIGDVGVDEAAFAHRGTLVEFGVGTSWTDPAEDAERIAAGRAYSAALRPFASGAYVNTLSERGGDGLERAYGAAKLARLGALKRAWDPDNVFHLNQNILPA